MPQIMNVEKGAYDFPDTEPAIACVEILPHRFVAINGVVRSLGKEVVLKDGKMVKQWTSDPDGRLWVPGRLVGPLTTPQGPEDVKGRIAPLAQFLGSRTEAEWKAGIDPLAKKEDVEGRPSKRRQIPSMAADAVI